MKALSTRHWSDWAGTAAFTALALALWRQAPEYGVLVLPALVQELRKLRPDLPALCMTGYTRDEMQNEDGLEGVEFIEKPFAPAVFLERVRNLLPERD